MRFRSLVVAASACATLAACDGLREALTAHVDVAVRAGSHELSVQRLAELLGNSKLGIPVNKQTAQTVATLWGDYQLLGLAAAHGDTVIDHKAIDEAAAGFIAGLRLQRLTDSIGKTFKLDSATEAGYNEGRSGLYAARHILFGTNPTMTPAQKDSVRKLAESVRAQVTDANFAEMAAKYSTEPGAAQSKGNLGVFPRQMMVKPFADAVARLKPGEISGPIETQFGYHIVQRLPYGAAREQYQANYGRSARMVAESTYLVGLEQKGKIEVKDDAGAKVKSAMKDPVAHRKDDEVLATYDGGSLSIGRLITWINGTSNGPQIIQQLQTLPDSSVKDIVKRVVRNELLLKEADRLKIDVTPAEKQELYGQFSQIIRTLWDQLGISPKALADSAKTVPEREKLAAARVDAYMDRLLGGQAQPIQVPPVLGNILADKYELKTNQQAIDQAVEKAQKIRVVADSARAASQPQSAVPLPGAGAPPGGAQPQPQPQVPQPKAPQPQQPQTGKP